MGLATALHIALEQDAQRSQMNQRKAYMYIDPFARKNCHKYCEYIKLQKFIETKTANHYESFTFAQQNLLSRGITHYLSWQNLRSQQTYYLIRQKPGFVRLSGQFLRDQKVNYAARNKFCREKTSLP